MSYDGNAIARELVKRGMDESQLIEALEDMRALTVRLLADHGHQIAPDLQEKLQSHVSTLTPILNPAFRPNGIHSDPFVPKLAAHKLAYFANEQGYIACLLDGDGRDIFKHSVLRNSEVNDGGLTLSRTVIFDQELESPSATTGVQLRQTAEMWELPYRKPQVEEDPSLEARLIEDLEQYHATNRGPGL